MRKCKKFLALLLSLCMVFSLLSVGASAAGGVTLTTNPASPANGDSVTITASVDGGTWYYTPNGGPNAGVASAVTGNGASYTFTLVTDPGPTETAGVYSYEVGGQTYTITIPASTDTSATPADASTNAAAPADGAPADGAPADAAPADAAPADAAPADAAPAAGGDAAMGGGATAAASTGATSSADLTDFASVKHQDAVSLMVKLGLINGMVQTDGTVAYVPTKSFTRAEMAKIIAMALELVPEEEAVSDTASGGMDMMMMMMGGGEAAAEPEEVAPAFSDISGHWAETYITACADAGVIDGVGDGSFNPDGTITVLETAKMLLAAMGVEGLTGTDWETAATAAAATYGLFTDVTASMSSNITRDDAAQVIYNALTSSKNDGSGALPNVLVFTENTKKTVEVGDNTLVTAVEGKLLTAIVKGVEVDINEPGTYANAQIIITDNFGQIGSFGGGGADDYDYRTGLYIDKDGINEDLSISEAISGGKVTASEISGISMDSTSDNFNGIMVNGDTDVTIKDSTFNFLSDSDGSAVNDFSGYGAVVAAYNGAKVTLDNVLINTSGVARLSSFTDEKATTIFKDSEINVMGGTLYADYANSANQATMVAPPWVLGITGNARGTNLEGSCSSTIVVNSKMNANQWGVISTDAGSDMQLFIVDSTLTLLGEGQTNDPFSENYGSGYGTYAIGSAQEYFYGVTMNVGTYATIFTGGYATFASSNGTFEVNPLDTNAAKYDFLGTELTGYSDEVLTTVVGQGKNTVINSDAFGFMCHGAAGILVTDNTIVNTDNAAFLLKVGNVNIEVSDGAQLNVEDGVILQMMDNDDSLVGMGDMSTMAFNTTYHEDAGWHKGVDAVSGNSPVTFNAEDVTLNGNFYNGSGNYAVTSMSGDTSYTGNTLQITLGKDTTLNGAAASTAVMHVDENGRQVTDFTIDEYYYLGHLANANFYNGANGVEVTMKDGAIWNVTGNSLLTKLVVDKAANIKAATGTLVVTVNGEKVTLEDGKTYEGQISLSIDYGTTLTVSSNMKLSETLNLTKLVVAEKATLTAAAGRLLTMTVDGKETAIESGKTYTGTIVLDVTDNYGQIGSFGGGGADDYDFRAGLYVDETGIVDSKSVQSAIVGGTYDATGATGITIDSTSDNFNGIIVNGTKYTIKNSTLNFISNSDGSAVNDFSGYGAAIAAYNGAVVSIEDSTVNTKGVARLSSFTDEYAHTIFKNSEINVMGGKLYDGYINSANQATMVAPPWVLGITGNARGTNLEGSCSSTIVVNSKMNANQWGVISTDAGKDMQLFIIDSTMTLLGQGQTNDPFSENYGSGYGTYAIGSAQEYFYGVTMNVGTYATIFTGGYATFASSNGTFEVNPLDTDAPTYDFLGTQLTGYSDEVLTTVVGQGKNTVINSDAFGFMCHGAAGILVTDNTIVNTDNAVFLLKVGNVNIEVSDGAQLNVEDGVILQMMDNDDSLVGMGDMSTMGFNTTYHEASGWAKGVGSVSGNSPVTFNAEDVTLNGNFYNGSGNYAVTSMSGNTSYTGNPLKITLGKGATLNGTISSTAVMHVNENGKQVTDFTINEYYYLGHLANTNFYNGANDIDVTLEAGSTWNVTETGIIKSLTIAEGATFNGVQTKNADGTITVSPAK